MRKKCQSPRRFRVPPLNRSKRSAQAQVDALHSTRVLTLTQLARAAERKFVTLFRCFVHDLNTRDNTNMTHNTQHTNKQTFFTSNTNVYVTLSRSVPGQSEAALYVNRVPPETHSTLFLSSTIHPLF